MLHCIRLIDKGCENKRSGGIWLTKYHWDLISYLGFDELAVKTYSQLFVA